MTSMGELLEREREKRQWTQRAMAAALGTGQRHYREWIAGKSMFSGSIHRVYLILGLDPEEVINSTFEPYEPHYVVPRKGAKQKPRIIDQPWAK